MARRDVPGLVYLIHLDRPIGNVQSRTGFARHYTGWAKDLDARLADHAAGRGSKLMAAVKQAGISWSVARTWPGTRARERQLKSQGGASRRCPQCGVTPRKDGTQMSTKPQDAGRQKPACQPGKPQLAVGTQADLPAQRPAVQPAEPGTWAKRALRDAALRNREVMRKQIEEDREAGR